MRTIEHRQILFRIAMVLATSCCLCVVADPAKTDPWKGDPLRCVDETDIKVDDRLIRRISEILKESQFLEEEDFVKEKNFIRVNNCELFYTISLVPRAASETVEGQIFVGHSIVIFIPRSQFISIYDAPYLTMVL